MKNIKILLIILLSYSTVSCRKEPLTKIENPDFSRAYPLQIGNYWIYRSTILFKNGFVQRFETTDSVWIDRDTVINRKLYWVKKSSVHGSELLTDSSGTILLKSKDEHYAIFNKKNYKDTILRTAAFRRIMADINEEVNVVAGTFKTISCKTLMKMGSDHQHMEDFPIHDFDFHLHDQTLFANEVGIVKRISYFLGNKTEENLEKYYIKK
ncbi:MAG TPA: hypothetical protein VF691_15470 [Cytophagaceae bacterium]|jgi:hypothetical protein